jgi:hypothetical protein
MVMREIHVKLFSLTRAPRESENLNPALGTFESLLAALKPRPAFLPMLNGIVEYEEARGLLLVER